jgi:DNA-binding transcriptional MerR regulator
MKIGDVARRAGVSTKTVRFYESPGLLTVARLPNGYRDYDESHVSLVREIRMLAELGIRVQQTRPFLDCLVAGNSRGDDCRASLAAYRETIDALDSQIAELSSRRQKLADILGTAAERAEPACQFSPLGASHHDRSHYERENH